VKAKPQRTNWWVVQQDIITSSVFCLIASSEWKKMTRQERATIILSVQWLSNCTDYFLQENPTICHLFNSSKSMCSGYVIIQITFFKNLPQKEVKFAMIKFAIRITLHLFWGLSLVQFGNALANDNLKYPA
jgi:hypothetical protein